MSSVVDDVGGSIIAAAVVLPAAVAYGAAWLAWESGRLLVDAIVSIDSEIEMRKRQKEEAARLRRMAAVSAHDRLTQMCSQILSQLHTKNSAGDTESLAEIEQLKAELESIRKETLPDDTAQIESLTSLGYLKLDRIVRRQKQIAEMSASVSALDRASSVADLMDEIRLVVNTMSAYANKGENVAAADPEVLERMKLNEDFSRVTAEITAELETAKQIFAACGLTASARAWFESCFNGVDARIAALCGPAVTNAELKKGIRRLQEIVAQYRDIAPSIRKEQALYKVYEDAARALGEPVADIGAFKSAAELEEKLRSLKTRADKAAQCAEIYKKLGRAAYMCYALDQELQAMGYQVRSREKITEMADSRPAHAKIGEIEFPFYEWTDADLTQLYSVGSQCALQVIVHEDGSVSMQTIAEGEGDDVIRAQKHHCSQLVALRERLRKNWFILFDYAETQSPEVTQSVAQWRTAKGNAWRRSGGAVITDQRGSRKATDGKKSEEE